jgi:excinuclease ABC subunit C
MVEVAKEERFEEARELRDISITIKKLTISSNIDIAKDINLDIIAILNGEYRGVVVRIFMRKGKIISSSYNYFRHTHIYNQNNAYKQAILEFYNSDLPLTSQTILTADKFEDSQVVSSTLSKIFNRKIDIKTPQRGDKLKLVSMARDNAKELLRVESSKNYVEQNIANLLSLQSIPYRVESFDNSHLMGVATVGAMVVWEEEKWDKKSYRRYKLKSRDEIGQMREMLERRVEDFKNYPPPDLWILDGGRANLNIAKSILKNENINLDVIAIAKDKIGKRTNRAKGSARDIIYTNNDIIEISPNDKRLHWIQNKRDEAHRFVITYHQKIKREEDKEISLLNKKGIGEATVKKLINYFGSFSSIYNASQYEISAIVGDKIAKIIKDNN